MSAATPQAFCRRSRNALSQSATGVPLATVGPTHRAVREVLGNPTGLGAGGTPE